MANDMRIGFSMHPRWADSDHLEAFVNPLRQVGLSALEFELDDYIDRWEDFQPLMQAAVDLGLELSFHGPFRKPRSLVDFAGNRRAVVEQEFRPLLEIAERTAQGAGKPCILVTHAAVSRVSHPVESLVEDTFAYLKWVAETFPNLRIALENNHPAEGKEVKIGVRRGEILKLIDCLPPSRLGICWDFGHDYLSGETPEPPSEWLARVIHVHAHDVDETGEDHYPLVFGRVPYRPWLQALKQAGMKGIIVLELKGAHLKNWSLPDIQAALTGSIAALAEVII